MGQKSTAMKADWVGLLTDDFLTTEARTANTHFAKVAVQY